METGVLAILTGLACLAFTVQTATGFGAGLVLVTLGALVIPIQDAVTLLIPLSVVQTIVVLARFHGAVAWRLLLTLILPVMGVGAGIGAALVGQVGDSPVLKQVYGVLIVLFAVWELIQGRKAPVVDDGATEEAPPPPTGRLPAVIATFAAGVVHGIYATGGPLLVWAVDRLGLDKQAFRTTLMAVFLGLNVCLTTYFVVSGRLGRAHVVPLAWLSGGVGLGLVLGEWAHARVDERRFRQCVYVLLVLAGGALAAG